MKISSHLLLYCVLYLVIFGSIVPSILVSTQAITPHILPCLQHAPLELLPTGLVSLNKSDTPRLQGQVILRRGRLSSASDSLANLGWKPLHEYHHLNWIKLAKPPTRVHIIHSLSIFTCNVTCSRHYTRGKSSNRLILLGIEQNMVKDRQALS